MPINAANIVYLNVIDSTNNYAQRLIISKNAYNGQVIIANQQTAGKGQRNNRWQSSQGESLLMSYVFLPQNFQIQQQFYLNMTVAVSIVKILQNLTNECFSIKWPNDIYFEDKKLGGILIENGISGNKLSSSIIGIGINLNQNGFPQDLPNPISLFQVKKQTYNPKIIAVKIATEVESSLKKLDLESLTDLKQQYKFYLLGNSKWRKFKANNQIFNGRICDVNSFGQLVLELQNGKIENYNNGEIQFIF